MQISEPFKQSEDEYFRLKGLLATGRITPQQFEAALKERMVQDAQGRWWTIGADSGNWYVHDGKMWVKAEPPSISSVPSTRADLFQNVKLPSATWQWVTSNVPDNKVMRVKNLGRTVELSLTTYNQVPESAKDFLEGVRSQIAAKPTYAGGEVQPLETRQLAGQMWAVCSTRTKDSVYQELWARKINSNQLLFISFTAVSGRFNQFYNDCLAVVRYFSSYECSPSAQVRLL